jgi:hypothetical protein
VPYVSGNSVNVEGSAVAEPGQLHFSRIGHGKVGTLDAGPIGWVHGRWEGTMELSRTRSLGTPEPWSTEVTLHASATGEVTSGPTPHERRPVWTTLPPIFFPLGSLRVALSPAASTRSHESPSAAPVVEISAGWVPFVHVIVLP